MKRMLGLIAACCLFAVTAHAQSLDDIIKRGHITVGLDLADAPYGMLGSDMQPTGLDYDIAALIAKTMGVKLDIVQVTGPSRIPTLLNNRADIMLGGFAITAQRALQVSFSAPYDSGQTAVIAPAATPMKSLDDLAGKKIGVVRASTQDLTITAVAPKGTNIVRFDDDASSVQALVSGQVDGTVAGFVIAQAINAKNPEKHIEVKVVLRENPLGIGVRRGQQDLLNWLNTFVFDMKYTGTLAALHKKYNMPYSLPIF